MQTVNDALLENTELRLLLDGVVNCYGFDFRDYAAEPLKRRVWERVHAEELQTISGYQEKVLHDPRCLEQLVVALSSRDTALFDDPGFWQGFRAIVVPLLKTYPSMQLWLPACATGEEAYTLAIVLHEEGLSSRYRIYATDISAIVYERGREGLFPKGQVTKAAERYLKAGGKTQLADYYAIEKKRAAMAPFLRDRIVFAEHNLATDGPFNEFQAIVCRGALGLFNEWLQERAHSLFLQSLNRFGILALGDLESPRLPAGQEGFEPLPGAAGLYRKII
jgi:chemotaxis protein methyltransferase CheR